MAESAYVLTALGIPHHIAEEADSRLWVLSVPIDDAPRADRELTEYWAEHRTVAQRAPGQPAIDSGLIGVLGFLLVIWTLPWLESQYFLNWRHDGMMNAGAVRDGQWWRTLTALTLHADIGHIAGNSLFGVLFGLLAGRQLGSGVAWLFIVVAAAAANGVNAFAQGDTFRSLGASTATFAALGLVAAVVWRRGYYRATSWRRSFAPVFAAIALFAYTGVGDEDTDVAAHLFGGMTGLLAGLIAAQLPSRWLQRPQQWLAGGVTLGLIVLAWVCVG